MLFAKDAERPISKEAIAKSTVVTGNVRQFAIVENPADITTKKRLKLKTNPPAQLVMSYAGGFIIYAHSSSDDIDYSNGSKVDYSTSPYLTLMRSSFSSMGSAAMRMKITVAAAWIRSIGKPDT